MLPLEALAQDSATCGMTTRGPIPIHGKDGLVLGVVLGVGAIHGMNGLVVGTGSSEKRGRMLLIPTLLSYCHQRKCGDQPRFRRD